MLTMKKMLFSLVFALVASFGFAQNLDSLAVVREVDSLIQVSRGLMGDRDFDGALEVSRVAGNLTLEKFGRETVLYGNVSNNHGGILWAKGDLLEAEKWRLETKTIREKVSGKAHPDYAGALINLGLVYSDMILYEKAELLFFEAKTIFEVELRNLEHPFYANCLSGLASLYMAKGEYEKAEPLLLEVKTIRKNRYGENHLAYASSLNNLAQLYLTLNNCHKAEPLLLEAKKIREVKLGKKHPEYASSLSNLAILYSTMRKFEEAEPLLLEALIIRENTAGKDHPNYAQELINLSYLYSDMGRYEEAQPLLLEAKAIQERTMSREHPRYVTLLIGLGTLYMNKGEYEKSDSFYREAQPLLEKVFGKDHPEYETYLSVVTLFYERQQRYLDAENTIREANLLQFDHLSKAIYFLSEHELSQRIGIFEYEKNKLFNMILERGTRKSPIGSLPRLAFENSLFFKGFLLNSVNQIKRLSSFDSTSIQKFNELKTCHSRLAVEYSKPMAIRQGITELEEKANNLEKEIARTVRGFDKPVRFVSWQEVQNTLKIDEVALEFVHFPFYENKTELTDSILYAALLLRPGWQQPRMVGLFEEKAIQPLLNAANTQLYAARGDKKRGKAEKSEGIVVGIGETASLYQLIWQPLDSLLRGAKTVYFSPSGLLHRLNLSAIPIPGSDQVLGDRYKLVQLGSTRQLVVRSSSSSSSKTAALFGGLRFDGQMTTATFDTVTASATATNGIASLRRSLGARGDDTWDYLPGTEKEVQSVGKTLSKSGYTVQTFTSSDGSETAFKSLGTNKTSSPAVLHIATHGFFFPDPKDTLNRASFAVGREPVFKTSDNPLMRSGLILSGANRAWAGGKTPEGQEDGILTAYEISQMNLSNTELVVLSACETGLGDVAGNEGVYGLQRAFKIAGAKYLIMSLWQVPDKQTSLLMTAFYKKWLEEKMEIPEAFRAAQKEMREQGFDPYQWAGFVLVE